MKRESKFGFVILRADVTPFITNGGEYTAVVYLPQSADVSAWRDATAEEYEEWQRQQDEPEASAQEAIDYLFGGEEQ